MSAPDHGSVRDSIVACAWLTHRERVGQSGVAPLRGRSALDDVSHLQARAARPTPRDAGAGL